MTKKNEVALNSDNTPAMAMESNNPVMAMLSAAIEKDVDIDKLKQLMELNREFQAEISKREFLTAMAVFQSEAPAVEQSKTVDFDFNGTNTNYTYATLNDIDKAIKEPLKMAGLSYRFQCKQSDGQITVETLVSHTGGHTESLPLSAAIEVGNIKGIKAMSSTISYLKRYGLSMALGLITADVDDERALEIAEEGGVIRPSGNYPMLDEEVFKKRLPGWTKAVTEGQKTPDDIIQTVNNGGFHLTESQLNTVSNLGAKE